MAEVLVCFVGDSDSLAMIVTVHFAHRRRWDAADKIGPSVPLMMMVSVSVAWLTDASAVDCAQVTQPSTRKVTRTKTDVRIILNNIGRNPQVEA